MTYMLLYKERETMVKETKQRESLEYLHDGVKSRYAEWFGSLADVRGKAKVTKAVHQMKNGNFSNCKGLENGGGLQECRIDFGPGYRIYFSLYDDLVIMLFGGSDKDDQQKIIDQCKIDHKKFLEHKKAEKAKQEAKPHSASASTKKKSKKSKKGK